MLGRRQSILQHTHLMACDSSTMCGLLLFHFIPVFGGALVKFIYTAKNHIFVSEGFTVFKILSIPELSEGKTSQKMKLI